MTHLYINLFKCSLASYIIYKIFHFLQSLKNFVLYLCSSFLLLFFWNIVPTACNSIVKQPNVMYPTFYSLFKFGIFFYSAVHYGNAFQDNWFKLNLPIFIDGILHGTDV